MTHIHRLADHTCRSAGPSCDCSVESRECRPLPPEHHQARRQGPRLGGASARQYPPESLAWILPTPTLTQGEGSGDERRLCTGCEVEAEGLSSAGSNRRTWRHRRADLPAPSRLAGDAGNRPGAASVAPRSLPARTSNSIGTRSRPAITSSRVALRMRNLEGKSSRSPPGRSSTPRPVSLAHTVGGSRLTRAARHSCHQRYQPKNAVHRRQGKETLLHRP